MREHNKRVLNIQSSLVTGQIVDVNLLETNDAQQQQQQQQQQISGFVQGGEGHTMGQEGKERRKGDGEEGRAVVLWPPPLCGSVSSALEAEELRVAARGALAFQQVCCVCGGRMCVLCVCVFVCGMLGVSVSGCAYVDV